MKRKRTRVFISVFLFNLVFSVFYFFDGLDYKFSALSTDLHNIIPIIQKLDNPDLFHKDLYLDDIANVDYYTPFFIKSLHAASSLVDQDYILGLNLLNTISHLLYGLFWFYFFYRFSENFWLSFIFSVLLKGIIWLPGFEFWGISNLGLLLPRTIYFTLLPIPFLLLKDYSLFKLVLASFLIGLIFNFHPISGLGGILLFLIFIVYLYYNSGSKKYISGNYFPLLLLALIAGMSPFLMTYFQNTDATITYDLGLYETAFNERISSKFSNPSYYLKEWLKLKYLFFYIPFVIYMYVGFKDLAERKTAKLLLISVLALLILPNISVYVEDAMNTMFNSNLRMSFQLIRIQKLVIIPYYFSMFFLVLYLIKEFSFLKRSLSSVAIIFITSLVFCNLSVFDKVPFVGDDIFRLILPSNISFGTKHSNTLSDEDKMAQVITEKTTINAVIYGSHYYRVASKRSVLLDHKGASMLIEGNPEKLVQWYQNRKMIESITDDTQRVNYIKGLGATHVVTKSKLNFLKVLHKEGDLILYSLK